MSDKIPMTQQCYKLIEAELRQLIKVERPSVLEALETAAGNGDITENADFEAAKERQAFVEGRINLLTDKIARANVIDPSSIVSDKIVFGATVTLLDLDNDKELTYQIVGADESDATNGKISVTSPIAKAMIGKREGDDFVVEAPSGEREFEIIKFEFV